MEEKKQAGKTQAGNLAMMIVLYCSAFVAAFNENTVNVALVSIMGEYGVGSDTAQWLVTGYMMVTAIIVVVSAFLYRRIPTKRLFFIGAGFLLAGSVICIASVNFPMLLVGRLVQSVGTGLFIPTMMSSVLILAPREKVATYLSIGGCMITFGPAFAPVVSGLVVVAAGWRAVFAVPAAIVVLVAIAAVFLVRNISGEEKLKLDAASLVFAAAGLFLFVYGLSIITSQTMMAIVFIVAGIAVFALFVRRQFRIETPVLNLKPLTSIKFFPSCLLVIVAMMTTFSMSVLLPLYYQTSLGYDALMAGLLLLPPILVNAITSVVGGRIMDARGPWPLLPIGFALITVGQIAVCVVAPQLSVVGVLVATIVVYAGVGLVFSPSQSTGLLTLPDRDHPHGVGILNTFVQIAACIGPSLFVGILSTVSAAGVAAGAAIEAANASGFTSAVTVAAIIACVGLVLSVFYSRSIGKLRG